MIKIFEFQDPRDAVVVKKSLRDKVSNLSHLPKGALIGSSSLRKESKKKLDFLDKFSKRKYLNYFICDSYYNNKFRYNEWKINNLSNLILIKAASTAQTKVSPLEDWISSWKFEYSVIYLITSSIFINIFFISDILVVLVSNFRSWTLLWILIQWCLPIKIDKCFFIGGQNLVLGPSQIYSRLGNLVLNLAVS